MGQAANQDGGLIGQVLPAEGGDGYMPDLPPAGGQAVNYGYTPAATAMPSSMGMPAMNLQAPEFGIVDPTYMAQLAILNQGAGNSMPAAAPTALMGLLGSGLESQEQFQANAPLLGGAPMIADWRAYSPNRSANADLNRAIAMSQAGGGNEYTDPNPAWTNMSNAEKAAYYRDNPTMAKITQFGQKAFGYLMPGLAAAQEYLNPGFAREQQMIAMGLNPNQDFGFGFNYGGDYDAFSGDRVSPGMGYVSDNSYETGGGGFDFSGGFADAGGGSFNYSADSGYDF